MLFLIPAAIGAASFIGGIATGFIVDNLTEQPTTVINTQTANVQTKEGELVRTGIKYAVGLGIAGLVWWKWGRRLKLGPPK
jgi:beta-galactosidase GanA